MNTDQLGLFVEPAVRDSLRTWAASYERELELPIALRQDPRPLHELTDRELFALAPQVDVVEIARLMAAEAAVEGRKLYGLTT
jgi:hypothetical protein